MNKIFERPHIIFWATIPIIILIGFFASEDVLDINIHDTYFVISYSHICNLIALIFGLIGLGYWVIIKSNRKLFKWLNVIHVISTIIGFMALYLLPYLIFKTKSDSDFPLYNDLSKQNIMITVILLLIVFSQLLYLINIVAGIFRKNNF